MDHTFDSTFVQLELITVVLEWREDGVLRDSFTAATELKQIPWNSNRPSFPSVWGLDGGYEKVSPWDGWMELWMLC